MEFNKLELPKNFKTVCPNDKTLYELLIQDSDSLIAESIVKMTSGGSSVFDIERQIKTFQNNKFSNWNDKIYWVDGSVSRYNLEYRICFKCFK